MRLIRYSIAFILLFLSKPIASHGQDKNSQPAINLELTSMLLAQAQCDKALPGYAEKVYPYYQEWRSANLGRVTKLESTARFKQQKAEVLQQLPSLSDKARIGLRKACAAMLTSLAPEYHFLRPQP